MFQWTICEQKRTPEHLTRLRYVDSMSSPCNNADMAPRKGPLPPLHLRLRALRVKLAEGDQRFTAAEMARALGISKSTIAKYESSKPDNPNMPQRTFYFDYIASFADYYTRIKGKQTNEIDLQIMATEAYDAQANESSKANAALVEIDEKIESARKALHELERLRSRAARGARARVDVATARWQSANRATRVYSPPTPSPLLEAEASVIGGILIHARKVSEVLEHCKPSDFYHPANRAIMEAIVELDNDSRPVDQLTVVEKMKALETFEKLNSGGGADYLIDLTTKVVTAENIAYHAKMVADKSRMRRDRRRRDGHPQRGIRGRNRPRRIHRRRRAPRV
jgi:transcriptional regulator with XRE-family HTH domain